MLTKFLVIGPAVMNLKPLALSLSKGGVFRWLRQAQPERSFQEQKSRRHNACCDQLGVTLIELIIFIVIISVGLFGILSVMNTTTRASADPMVRKQSMAFAEAVLEEVLSKDATATLPETDMANCSNRRFYVGIRDYACFDGVPATAVIRGNVTLGSAANAALAGLSATVAVGAITSISGVDMRQVTVTVTGNNENIAISGFRAVNF